MTILSLGKQNKKVKERAIKITLYKVYCICCGDTTSAISSPSLNWKVKRHITEEKKVEENKDN